MSHLEIFKLILERKHWILLVFCLTAVFVAYYQWQTPYSYRSTVKVFIEDEEFYSNDLNLVKSSPQSRISYDATSTEMFDYLIQKFNLYSHYGIDSKAPMHYETITSVLNNNINTNCEGRFVLTISVRDEDKYLASDMANEIYKKLTEMNKAYIITLAEKKLNIYQQIMNNNKKEISAQTQEFSTLIEECKTLSSFKRYSPEQLNLFSDIKIKLGGLESQLTGINNEMLNSTKIYELSAAAMQKDNIATLRLVNIALPDTHVPFNARMYNTIILALVAAMFTVFFIVVFFEFRPYFRLAFKV